MTGQGPGIAGMPFKQFDLVVAPHQVLHDKRRTGVDLVHIIGVEAGQHVEVVAQGRCGCTLALDQARHQGQQTFGGLAAGLGRGAVQAVKPGTRMGVNGQHLGFFGAQMLEDGDQNRVLEHVGMIACVVSMAVTEHATMVPAGVVATAPCLCGQGRPRAGVAEFV